LTISGTRFGFIRNKPKIDFFVSIRREFPRAKCEHFCSDCFNPDLLSSN
jgi:hypothetical protein